MLAVPVSPSLVCLQLSVKSVGVASLSILMMVVVVFAGVVVVVRDGDTRSFCFGHIYTLNLCVSAFA